tara:strand:+ start:76 stop:1425 length:1350 start_codon:yes stop_codon:yes gene_type:complete
MKNIVNDFNKLIFLEKIVLILVLLLPFALCLSIFVADLFTSIIALVILFWFFKNQEFRQIIRNIQKPLSVIILFYFLIIISLVFSINFNKSFLPSFFYFRYFFLSLAIFFLMFKFEFSLKMILFSLLSLMALITVHSSIELLKINNFFGLTLPQHKFEAGSGYYLTSLFYDEKKLGSFIVRLLPFIISLLVLFEIKFLKKIDIKFIILILSGILVFFTSERVALFLFIFFFIFSLKIFKKKIFIFLFLIFSIITISISQPRLIDKYIPSTLTQFGILDTYTIYDEKDKLIPFWNKMNFSNMNYISEEHQKLIKSGIEIFKENPITGSGIKTYHRYCKNLKEKKKLDIKCSSHPHNTYVQILSDIGLFGSITIFLILIYLLSINLKILLIKSPSNYLKSYFILNLGIIINLMPFIPSGSFFNNWINLMIYYPIGFWFYLFYKLRKKNNEH